MIYHNLTFQNNKAPAILYCLITQLIFTTNWSNSLLCRFSLVFTWNLLCCDWFCNTNSSFELPDLEIPNPTLNFFNSSAMMMQKRKNNINKIHCPYCAENNRHCKDLDGLIYFRRWKWKYCLKKLMLFFQVDLLCFYYLCYLCCKNCGMECWFDCVLC